MDKNRIRTVYGDNVMDTFESLNLKSMKELKLNKANFKLINKKR